jgi:uncharacterized membrane protein
VDYPLWNAFMTMMWFFLWMLWLFLLFTIISDIFRSHDMNGWAKAGWLVFVIVLPYLGVFIYLIVRGSRMQDRRAGAASGPAQDLDQLADLRSRGIISDEEFQRGKEKVLST